MKTPTILALAIILLATSAMADDTTICTNGPQERVISVVYLQSGEKVPCEVRYQKDGTTETLWSANNEAGYCEEKARAFVEKQRGWGWTCAAEGGGETNR